MKRIVLPALLASIAGPALADEITLSKPAAGTTLHESGTEMSVYYTEADAAYEVVATYLTGRDAEPARVAMQLEDGDAVSFGLPGARGTIFTFARDGGDLTVRSASTAQDFASN